MADTGKTAGAATGSFLGNLSDRPTRRRYPVTAPSGQQFEVESPIPLTQEQLDVIGQGLQPAGSKAATAIRTAAQGLIAARRSRPGWGLASMAVSPAAEAAAQYLEWAEGVRDRPDYARMGLETLAPALVFEPQEAGKIPPNWETVYERQKKMGPPGKPPPVGRIWYKPGPSPTYDEPTGGVTGWPGEDPSALPRDPRDLPMDPYGRPAPQGGLPRDPRRVRGGEEAGPGDYWRDLPTPPGERVPPTRGWYEPEPPQSKLPPTWRKGPDMPPIPKYEPMPPPMSRAPRPRNPALPYKKPDPEELEDREMLRPFWGPRSPVRRFIQGSGQAALRAALGEEGYYRPAMNPQFTRRIDAELEGRQSGTPVYKAFERFTNDELSQLRDMTVRDESDVSGRQ